MGKDKINIELTTIELSRLILALEKRTEEIKCSDFNLLIEEHKRLLKRLREIRQNHINND